MSYVTLDWIHAGKAVFTVNNDKGTHYTYQVKRKDASERWSEAYFVSLLTGPDNEADYTYIGMLAANRVRLTRASKYTPACQPVRVLDWLLAKLEAKEALPEGYAVNGEGRCGRCGRMLTHPDGLDEGYRNGFGPECWKKING